MQNTTINQNDPYNLLPMLKEISVLRDSHFILKNPPEARCHSAHYFEKTTIWTHPRVAEQVCFAIADSLYFSGLSRDVQVIMGPALGAIIPAFLTALNLSENVGREVLSVWAEKDGKGGFVLPRLFAEVVEGKKVIAIEDVTTGVESIVTSSSAVTRAGGNLIGAVIVCNRSGKTDSEIAKKIGVPWAKSLITLDLPKFAPSECPYCNDPEQYRPIVTNLGYGGEFALANPEIVSRIGTITI